MATYREPLYPATNDTAPLAFIRECDSVLTKYVVTTIDEAGISPETHAKSQYAGMHL